MEAAYQKLVRLESQLHPEGVQRAPLWQFVLWLGFFGTVLLWGVYAMFLCWFKGLNQTNMNDYYGFALWIWADLAVIAVGGGAFFTGLLRYVIGKDPLKYIINYAVLIGFICYSSALLILAIDIGQPLRGWFIFWHANVHSMLTEVAFCLSCYFGVLCIEYIPLVLENRKLDEIPFFHHTAHNFHEVMAIFAATGAFLSFFHQGSLGGVAGVLFGRPFAYRPEFYIWPTTFFLFTWSAAACGPCFTILVTKITEAITRKKLVKDNVVELLAKIAGWMLLTYSIAKIADTLYWGFVMLPKHGLQITDFYTNASLIYTKLGGVPWILLIEILCSVIPALILVSKKGRQSKPALVVAVLLGSMCAMINRWVMVLQVMAAPIMTFDQFALYFPSWQELATTVLPVAYGVILISLSHRYLPVFPQERELNPV
ncbi:prokaryotic molybdopterin-containing oxidoreductase family, membrane subunit [Desulfatibacillum alkenivorans DSM 16219]|jgi:molybdopterin-containing oxidoreductase family membrane subunit|uniref:Prokaryotic molybdopterin-containing oxidoreductase family, membrane subunit n=1 Tax=Desulfatibacillum alkenivorans DSM 16219 TaxID=1121393 RepID=A0A1M6XQ72_9BACT|nr:menaquinone reductase integral membrane subunit QrcD [Desulfatibacillum alkenivorans]SHL08111.1 prokaryotic molybdopterin-containing oxidoreductase family, membrane subunit [Desulfatibacillum alkenivorans DSM 16219]